MNYTLITLYTLFLLCINIAGYQISGWSFGFLFLVAISALGCIYTFNLELSRVRKNARQRREYDEIRLQILSLGKTDRKEDVE